MRMCVRFKLRICKNFANPCRKQFPLTVAYAITVHKCQGLSLYCAIVDLSDKVFCAGMAYVTVSWVRSLDGLYLTSFNLALIIVSIDCLIQVNRLWSHIRNNLPLYAVTKQRGVKRKSNLDSNDLTPPAKKISKGKTTTRPLSSDDVTHSELKKTKCIPLQTVQHPVVRSVWLLLFTGRSLANWMKRLQVLPHW